MTPNELLLWLSARKEGSWPQFRAAVEMLELTDGTDQEEQAGTLGMHTRVYLNLERLAHVEFAASESRRGWRVVPPALALLHHRDCAIGVLCGARTPNLLERAEKAADGLRLERHSEPDCPDIVRVIGTPETLVDFAGRVRILCQADAPVALLAHLPPVTTLDGFKRAPMPASGREWNVQHLVIERRTARWHAVTLREANASGAQGLFRFTRYQMPQCYLREGRETILLPDAVGKYYILFERHRHVLKYDRKDRSLTIPAIFRPPLLTERALILCSGFPPSVSALRGRRALVYRGIPEEIAGIAAETLRQKL